MSGETICYLFFSFLVLHGLAMLSKGFYSTSVSIYYLFSLLEFTFSLALKPLLGIAFVSSRLY